MVKIRDTISFIITAIARFVVGGSGVEMSRLRFIMRILVVLAISIIFTCIVTFTAHKNWLEVFQEPDTALAWIALFVTFAVWAQQAVKLRGISYYLRSPEERKETDPNLIPISKGLGYLKVLGTLHWVSLVAFVFLFVQLVFGTVIELANLDNEMAKENIQSIIQSNQEVTQELIQSWHEDMQN